MYKQVSYWYNETARLNCSYSLIARSSSLLPTEPASRTISPETLRKWKKASKEFTYICSQAAECNRCLTGVQNTMQKKVKVIQSDQKKEKSSSKCQTATEELQYLMDFNESISLAMAKTMQQLSHFLFISMANITLARRDSYLYHLRYGIKQDTLDALRTAPLHMATLFLDLRSRGRPSTVGKQRLPCFIFS